MNRQQIINKMYQTRQEAAFRTEIRNEKAEAQRMLDLLATVSMSDVLDGKAEDVAMEIAAGLENLGAKGNILKVTFPQVQQLQNVAKMYGLF